MNIYNMTVAELIELGAKVDVHFHYNETKEDAYSSIKRFDNLNDIKEFNNGNDLGWFKSNVESIEAVSFYDK